MNCEETRVLLHGYLDRELDPVHSLEVERHLQGCAGCSQEYRSHQALKSAFRDGSLAYQAPPGLSRRVQQLARQGTRAEAPRPARLWRLSWAAAAVGVMAAVALITWGGFHAGATLTANDRLAQEVTAGHVRSLMANHLMDVASTDQHTVKPWFAGKLDFSPPVTDLRAQGFPLVGGRLDDMDDQPVAALVYRRRLHEINVFIWPSPGASEVSPTAMTRQGYHLIHWTQAGMTEWAVSDLNAAELGTFVELLRDAPPAPPSSR